MATKVRAKRVGKKASHAGRAVSEKQLNAKRAAVERFLSRGEDFEAFTALAASTKPEQNVVGVGLGPKQRDGETVAGTCVRFYVERKVDEASIPAAFVLPKEIEGVPTDVVETGRFDAFAKPVAQTRLRPAKGGCSVGFQFTGAKAGFVMAGTFGALVTDPSGARYILSNNHVLANENKLAPGSAIFQPGLLDGGVTATDQIARLTRFIRIIAAPTLNKVDCAIAELLDPGLAARTILPKVGNLKSTAPVSAAVGMKVHKHGRTTDYTQGNVIDVSATIKVGYSFGTAQFDDQIVIITGTPQPFSASGDSGSLIVDRATGQATGLLFAGSPSHTLANHIDEVLSALGISLL